MNDHKYKDSILVHYLSYNKNEEIPCIISESDDNSDNDECLIFFKNKF